MQEQVILAFKAGFGSCNWCHVSGFHVNGNLDVGTKCWHSIWLPESAVIGESPHGCHLCAVRHRIDEGILFEAQ
jgi:hypothetical protein